MKNSTLEEFEKICFTCTLPADKCGQRNVDCDFNKATKHKESLRYKQSFRQDFCGFPIVEEMTRSEAREIAEMAKRKWRISWMHGFR